MRITVFTGCNDDWHCDDNQPADVTAAAEWALKHEPASYEVDENSELGQIQTELAKMEAKIEEQLGITAAADVDFKCHGGARACDSLFQTLVKVDSNIDELTQMDTGTMALCGFVFSLLTFLLVLTLSILNFCMKKKQTNSVAMVTKG